MDVSNNLIQNNQCVINSMIIPRLGYKSNILLIVGLIYEIILFFMAMFSEKDKVQPNNICDQLINGYLIFYFGCNLFNILNILFIILKISRSVGRTITSLKYLAIIHLIMAIISLIPLSLGCIEKWFGESSVNFYVLNTKIYILVQIITSILVIFITYSIIILSCMPKFSVNFCKNICKKNYSSDTINNYNIV